MTLLVLGIGLILAGVIVISVALRISMSLGAQKEQHHARPD